MVRQPSQEPPTDSLHSLSNKHSEHHRFLQGDQYPKLGPGIARLLLLPFTV
jgi:hypothetical protein